MAGMRNFSFLISSIVIVMILLVTSPGSCSAEGKVVIVALTRASLIEAAANESMAPWLLRGSVSLLNISTAARPTSEHLYVTLGAGSRAIAPESVKLALSQHEEYLGVEAGALFLRHQGKKPSGQILHLGMAEMERVNRALQHPVQPGLLGDALREGGKVSAVIGNADSLVLAREAVAMLADSAGEVALGDVSKAVLKQDELFPFGWRTDREKVWQTFESIYSGADVVLVDWGDFIRLQKYRQHLREPVAKRLENEIFSDVSWFLNRVFVKLFPEDVLILLLPLSTEQGDVSQFGFLAALGGPFPPGGLLTSATTRRAGIVAATDVAPLVLEQVGLPTPGKMLGMTISVANPGGVPELLQMQTEIGRIFRLRPLLMKTYVFFQIVLVLGALFNMFVRIMPMRRFEAPLLGLMLFPLLVLLLPLHKVSMVMSFVLVSLAVMIAATLLQKLLHEPVQRFAAVAVSTSLALVLDLLRDAPLMKVSVLGYDAVSGARYYGLGNEYMGVLVGSTVLAVVTVLALASRYRRALYPVAAIYFLFVLLLIVAPGGGANFGGTITAVAAFVVTSMVLAQVRPGWRNGLAVLALLTVVAVVAVFLNLRVPQTAQSHLGRTIALLERDGWQALQDVIYRKAAMNVRLFRYSQWSRAFLAFLGVMAVLFYRPRGVLRDVQQMYPLLVAGFLGIIAGSVAAFLVNDSGVVAAATTLLYAGVPVILLTGRVVEQFPEKVGKHK